jgi:eukaryotic-like serine/threonine-protein kinase
MKRCRDCSAIENDEIQKCPSCSAAQWTPEPPMVVDARYEVTRKIGRGSMGIVYRARDTGLGRDVALKIIAPMYAREPDMVDRFQREARALALIRDDHVVQVYAFGQYGRSYYFAMEYVDGTGLDVVLERYRQNGEVVPVERALTLLRQVGMGLAAVHARDLVHRDVKPSNIVVEQDSGRPVVLDFGLVHRPRRGEDAKTMRSGTPSYMAPEQSSDMVLDSAAITPRTDVYALGCMAFELFTGVTPFAATDPLEVWRLHKSAPPPALSSRRPDLHALDPVIARALEKDAASRYATCEGFVTALSKAALSLGGLHRAGVPRPPSTSPSLAGALLRMLVVDPVEERRQKLVDAMQAAARMAVTVDAAGTAAQALPLLRQAPDVVVVNLDELGPDGAMVLSALRDGPGGEQARVLVVGSGEIVRQSWRFDVFGVRDFLLDGADVVAATEALRSVGARAGWAR